jgi:hypothetical protein
MFASPSSAIFKRASVVDAVLLKVSVAKRLFFNARGGLGRRLALAVEVKVPAWFGFLFFLDYSFIAFIGKTFFWFSATSLYFGSSDCDLC